MTNLKKFKHGGNIESFAKSLNCKVKDIVDLSSNINFVKPQIKIDFNHLDISYYPSYSALYNKISKLYSINHNEIELFNGGSSAIFTLFNHFKLKNCTIYSPAYLEYKKASEVFGYNLDLINRFDNIFKKVKQNTLVIFVNPSTPDGKYYNKSIMKKLFSIWEKANATVLIDESFLQFSKGSSVIKYIKQYKKLYILKSMTKIYSSAGIRVGGVISNKKNIKNLRKTQPMWKISQFDSNYLLKAIDDKKFLKKSSKINKKAKQYLLKILKNSKFNMKIYPSDANFVLIKLKNINAVQFQEILKPYKIMIRDCSNFDFLDDRYVRIAVKDIGQLKKLKQGLL